MDIDSISSGAITTNTQQKSGNAVGIAVANKTLDIQAGSAAQLINSVAKSTATEDHLGGKFNDYA